MEVSDAFIDGVHKIANSDKMKPKNVMYPRELLRNDVERILKSAALLLDEWEKQK